MSRCQSESLIFETPNLRIGHIESGSFRTIDPCFFGQLSNFGLLADFESDSTKSKFWNPILIGERIQELGLLFMSHSDVILGLNRELGFTKV